MASTATLPPTSSPRGPRFRGSCGSQLSLLSIVGPTQSGLRWGFLSKSLSGLFFGRLWDATNKLPEVALVLLPNDAYAGVDSFNVNVTMSIIRLAVVSPGDLADGVVSGGGGRVPEPAAESAGSLLRTTYHPLLLLGFGNASSEERSVSHRWTGTAGGPVWGYSALTLVITGVEFDDEWSFFLREMLEVDVRRMHFRARRNIDALLADVPPPAAGLFLLTDASVDIGAVPGLQLLAGVRRMATSPGHRSLRGFGGSHLGRHIHAAGPPPTFAVGQGP